MIEQPVGKQSMISHGAQLYSSFGRPRHRLMPVGASGAAGEEIAPALKNVAIVTDVGSAKAFVIVKMLPFVQEGVYSSPAI